MKFATREAWLQKAVELFREGVFKQHSLKIPVINVSVSFPYASRGTKRVGECWYPTMSDDKKFHIHVSPIHGTGFGAIDTLVHELVHVVAGQAAKHGPMFGAVARKVGLKGPMRSTPDMTEELRAEIHKMLKVLGPYPHGKLNPEQGRKKQTTRMYKMECKECGYIVRAARKYILVSGPVYCPCNHEAMDYDEALEHEIDQILTDIEAPSAG